MKHRSMIEDITKNAPPERRWSRDRGLTTVSGGLFPTRKPESIGIMRG